jgi:alkylation response protein AidB-like acyl-CoA dehydrogenase
MDFGVTPAEEAFAADAGYGSGAHSRAFLRALAGRGGLSMTWPRENGGHERPMMLELILLEELAAASGTST